MPANSTSFVLSTSIYLLSSALFLGAVYSPIEGSVRSAETLSVENIADGLQLQLNSLAPGTRITLSMEETASSIPVSVSLHNHTLTVSFHQIVARRPVAWILPNLTMSPDTRYSVSLRGDVVEFEETTRVG